MRAEKYLLKRQKNFLNKKNKDITGACRQMSEMFSIFGTATGTASATSGDFPLESDLWRGSVTEIRIPSSCKAKIWAKRIAGDAVVVKIRATRDITADTPTWYIRDLQQKLASPGELIVEKRKPIIINGRTGKEAIRVSWELAADAVSNFDGEIEIEGEKDE